MIKNLKARWVHQRKKLSQKWQKKQQQEQLEDADVLESNAPFYQAYWMIGLISLVVTSLIVWAIFTDVEEIARTNGEVIPAQKIVDIQHPHGGMVKSVFVNNGDVVKKGQALVQLDPITIQTELEKNIYRLVTLTADKIRLQSNLANKTLTNEQFFEKLKKTINVPADYSNTVATLLQDSALQASLEQSTDLSEIAVLKKQIQQNEIELKLLIQKTSMQEEMRSVMREELAMYDKLKQKNLASQREVLAVKRQYIKLRSDELETQKKIEKQKELLQEYQNKLDQANSTNRLEMVSKLNLISAEIVQTEQNIIKFQDQFDKLVIRSPIPGVVKGLAVTEGSVISSNETLMDIVPSEAHLVVETKISSRDIGYVKVGDLVKIKVSSYEYIKYGMLDGTLKYISATTFLDEKTNMVYYKGVIALSQSYLGHDPKRNKLIPGMLVEADIYTGKKSVMDYLLKPIYRATQISFRER
jgi:HlyD family type I secretion membrane fusion protein